ncbi:MAG: ribosome-associated translation inhibitor RaiA [bacterium]
MQIQIRAKNFDITPAIEEYVQKKIEDVSKFIGHKSKDAMVEVRLARTTTHHKEGEIFEVDADIRHIGFECDADAEANDLYSAIDQIKDELIHQVESHKEKRVSLVRQGGAQLKAMIKGLKFWK